MTMGKLARNRVSPLGDIIVAPGRGAWMGNRGRLHQGRGTRDIVRNHQHKTWITCAVSFRGRRVAQWEPNRYTPLFFLDEAVALSAGHRPCAECRHNAYREYRRMQHALRLNNAKSRVDPALVADKVAAVRALWQYVFEQ